jgi:hypothetical protein
VQAERVTDLEPERLGFAGRWRGLGGRSRDLVAAELRDLSLQPAACLRRHLVKRAAQPCGDSRRHRTLDERRLAEQHAFALPGIQQVERSLGAEDGAAEVHQHEHAVAGVGAANRLGDQDGVGAEGAFLGEPTGGLDPDVRARHLGGEPAHAVRQRGAVRDDHDPDHAYWLPRP